MSAVVKPDRLRITIEQYQKMGETGILGPELRCELIDGEILIMSPIGDAHATISNLLTKQLVLALADAGPRDPPMCCC